MSSEKFIGLALVEAYYAVPKTSPIRIRREQKRGSFEAMMDSGLARSKIGLFATPPGKPFRP
jgi:hypothetical protein